MKRMSGAFVAGLSVVMSFGAVCAAGPVLGPEAYLSLSLQHHVELLQHRSNEAHLNLALRDAKQRYVPRLTVGAGWQESETARVRNPAPLPDTPSQLQRGAEADASASWRLPLGTRVQMRAEQQWGQQKGQVASGIPEDYLEVQTYSLEVTQPLLRGWTPAFNRLPLNLAESDYTQFDLQLTAIQWSVLESSLKGLVELQRQQDRVAIHEDLVETLSALHLAAEVFYGEGRVTLLELESLELQWHRMQHQLSRERSLLVERQRGLFQSLVMAEQPSVNTFDDMRALTSWLTLSLPEESGAMNTDRLRHATEHHPELRLEQINLQQARWRYEQERRSHWPEFEVFYRYEQSDREKLPDSETQSWGLRFEYTLNNLPVRTQQAQRQSSLSQAQWSVEDKRKQLMQQHDTLVSEVEYWVEQQRLTAQQVMLSERALDQERQRFEAGFSNARNVLRESQTLLEHRLEWADISTHYVNSLVAMLILHYQNPSDWLRSL